jgi:hypothetical protein
MKKNGIILALFMAAWTLAACKKDGGGAPDLKPAITAVGNNDGSPVTKTIGSAGGSIMSADGEMELIIPAGALATNTDITIQPITNNAPNGRRKAYRCLPDGLQFSKNITARFYYNDEDAAATLPEYMMTAYQNADGNWAVIEDITNDVGNKSLNASVNHFTDFSAFDIMRINPAALYLKTNQTGQYEVTGTGMSELNGVKLLTALLERPETWKANGVTGGNSQHGTITPSADQTTGVYTAPASTPATNPVEISAELNMPFTIDGQQFNKGILTAKAYIIGNRYSVEIESTNDIAIGTGEIFRMKDHLRFTVNVISPQGTVTGIQNSPPTIQKIANSTSGCNTTIDPIGTGPLNVHDRDVADVSVTPGHVVVTFGTTVEEIDPVANKACPGQQTQSGPIYIWGLAGAVIPITDNNQQQEINSQAGGQSVRILITPIQ